MRINQTRFILTLQLKDVLCSHQSKINVISASRSLEIASSARTGVPQALMTTGEAERRRTV